MIAAIIPAAGRSSRMGSPKALLPFRGSTFLEVIVGACSDLGLTPVVVALGGGVSKTFPLNALHDVALVENVDAELGPIGSIAAGVGVLNHTVDAALVWPVDQPHVSRSTLEALSKAFKDSKRAIVVPTFQGRGGHPVLLSRMVFPECVAAAARRATLRDVLRSDVSRVLRLPLNDAAIIEDIDTPEDYVRLLGERAPKAL